MTSTNPHSAVRNEQVLARQLSAGQQAAMALGCCFVIYSFIGVEIVGIAGGPWLLLLAIGYRLSRSAAACNQV